MQAAALAARMDLEFELSGGEFEDAVGQVRRFERTRVYVAIGAIAVVGVASLYLDTKVPAVAAAVAVVVLAVFGFRWLRVVRLAARSEAGLRGRCRVSLTAEGFSLQTASTSETLEWSQILHCTRTREAWLFVGAGGRLAFTVPRYVLTERQTTELTGFLSSWSKRRYRRVPATY